MKVFISWSGEPSKTVASFLHGWLPSVIQSVRPWMSASDIDAGKRWSGEIARELEQAKFGILCLTRSNQHAPWLVFEGGALAKTVDDSHLVPYLIGLGPTELTGPLTQFQTTRANKEETWALISTLNRLAENPLAEGQLHKTFEFWWPELEAELNNLPNEEDIGALPKRTREDMLGEVVEEVRRMARLIDAQPTYDPDLLYLLARVLIADETETVSGIFGTIPKRDFFGDIIGLTSTTEKERWVRILRSYLGHSSDFARSLKTPSTQLIQGNAADSEPANNDREQEPDKEEGS